MAKDFFETVVARAGFAGEFEALTETEIAGAVSGPYVPGEDGVWKVVASRVVQLLLGSPLHIRTFQTSDATLRMPSGDLPAASSDAQDGRFYFIRNDATAAGRISLEKYDGTVLGSLAPGDFAVVVHGDFDDWDVNLITMTPAPQTVIIQGEQGEQGEFGPPGLSIQGPTGDPGVTMVIEGEQGEPGIPGTPSTVPGPQGEPGQTIILEGEPGEMGPPGPPATTTQKVVIIFYATGRYRVATGIDIQESGQPFTISFVVMRREIAGTSGSTIVDVLKNGVTIFTTPSNRPTITAASGDAQRVTAIPDVISILPTDRLEMTIEQVEGGNPQDITLELISV